MTLGDADSFSSLQLTFEQIVVYLAQKFAFFSNKLFAYIFIYVALISEDDCPFSVSYHQYKFLSLVGFQRYQYLAHVRNVSIFENFNRAQGT